MMAEKIQTINPGAHPEEVFTLYSIPAFDAGIPQKVKGCEIGSLKQVLAENDVLLSKIIPNTRRAWITAQSNGSRLIGSSEWIVFRSDRIVPAYLRQVLLSDEFHARYMMTVAGVGGSLMRARPALVARIKVPLPSLGEQRKIARVLDAANALRVKRRETLLRLKSLTESIFVEMFGNRTTGSSWPHMSLRENVTEFRYGTSKKSQNKGIPTLRIPNVIGGSIDTEDLKLVPVETPEFMKLRLIDGDILFVRTNGNPDYVGRCAMFTESSVSALGLATNEFIYASYLIRARIDHNKLDPVFLREFLLGADGRYELRSHCKTSAGQYNINIEGLGAVIVPKVPLGLQKEFSSAVNRIERAQALHRVHLAHLDTLFASLQDLAFKGEL
jgi:type I restriction enzyme, S subunit